jgi:hypothetical protein
MEIKPDEITSILKSRIEGLDTSSADLTEIGTGSRTACRSRCSNFPTTSPRWR